MKTIPVSFLLAGVLLPAVCLAESSAPPLDQPAGDKGERRNHPRHFLEAWKLADTDHDSFISQAEFDALPRIMNLPAENRGKLFKRLDKDADGRLTRAELGAFGKPQDGPEQPMKRLWELDSDKSGGISFEEFKAGQVFMKLPPAKQEAVFGRLDTDGDRVITPKDRPDKKRNDGKHPEEGGGTHQFNRKLDLDGDGALSFEEFRAGPAVKDLTEDQQEDRFELLDRNRDQKISPEDFPAATSPPIR